jgi:hypothetical protein
MYAPNFAVEGGSQLSQSDRDQIARVISRHTVQKIDSISPGREKGTIEVGCGHWDQLSEGQRLTGDEFTLKKVNGQWTVVDKGLWIR